MRVLNIGSLNIDYVYSVDHIVKPGETQAAYSMHISAGGKGLNQSIAMAKAGIVVHHAGMIGDDGQLFLDICNQYGVDASYIQVIDSKSGHTIIQVDKEAQNSILLNGGANYAITTSYIEQVLCEFEKNDILVLQNEVNLLPYIIDCAYAKGMNIVLNPSPFNEAIKECDLSKISMFILNEIEGKELTGASDTYDIIKIMRRRFETARVVLTLGEEGSIYADEKVLIKQPIFKVKAVDTTAAGDTFLGYFVAGVAKEMEVPDILKMCAKASAIAITRKGAVSSIPMLEEIARVD